MVTISIGVILALLVLGFVFVVSTVRRNAIYDRIVNFVPGRRLEVAKKMKRRSNRVSVSTESRIDTELPDLVSVMSAVLLAGESIQTAIEWVAEHGQGTFATELQGMVARLNLGSTVDVELQKLCTELPTPGVLDFSNKLTIAMHRGTPLAQSLENLAQTIRRKNANRLLSKAGANETKMLIPLVAIVLPTTVMFALYPSSQVLQVGF